MKRYDLITPEGTRDLLFTECLARRAVENKLKKLFTGFGYSEVVTPGIEFYDLFSGSSRNFQQENLYKLVDSKGRLITLRPDSTIPIARLVATRLAQAKLPLRLYYNQNIFENNALLKGRSDEISQAGIELIGGGNINRADYEALCTAVNALSSFDSEDFRLEIGHIGYFKELVSKLDVDDSVREEIRLLISAKNYPALNDVLDEIGDNQITKALKQLPRLFGGIEVLDKAAEIFTDDNITKILDYLREVFDRLSSLGYDGKISLDLGIVSHTDYYTGIVFKGYLTGVGQPVLKGGRYDKLIGEFGKSYPAVGFGINCDLVSQHTIKNGTAPEQKLPDCIIYGENNCVVQALAFGQELVRKGMTIENSLFDTLDETKEYAKETGIQKIYVIDSNNDVKEITL